MWTCSHPFSIVLCTYNGERFLDEQLVSLREQEGVAEIVVSDDGSTDASLAILRRHAAEDARIRIHRNGGRRGVTGNFEHGIGLARSPWIVLSDQDDIWLPGKLSRVRASWDGSATLIHHSSRKFRGAVPPREIGRTGREWRKFRGEDWRRLLYRNSIVGHTVVFRAGLAAKIEPFPPELPHDWWLGVGAALNGGVQYVDESLVHYRIHERNSYHVAGSRLRRLREEHALRLALLKTLIERRMIAGPHAAFAENYFARLCASEAGTFSWRLWSFYLWHAPVFFGGVQVEPSELTCFRKSCAAALAAVVQASPALLNSGSAML